MVKAISCQKAIHHFFNLAGYLSGELFARRDHHTLPRPGYDLPHAIQIEVDASWLTFFQQLHGDEANARSFAWISHD